MIEYLTSTPALIAGLIALTLYWANRINNRFDKIDAKIDSKFDRMDAKFDALIKSISDRNIDVENRITQLEAK